MADRLLEGGSSQSAQVSSRSWLTVDLDAIAKNVAWLKSFIGDRTKLLAVVKGQAYGLGREIEIAKIALTNGAEYLGVELLAEAVELRQGGIQAPVLMLGPVGPEDAETIVSHNISATVRDFQTLREIDRLARAQQHTITLHLELETGLNRFGNSAEQVHALACAIRDMPNVALEGVWTHFPSSELPQDDQTQGQFEKYLMLLRSLESAGISPPSRHVCGSAAVLRYQHMHLDMVRSGKLVYGIPPLNDEVLDLNLRSVVSWKTRLCHIRVLEKGEGVSYGGIWVAPKRSRIGIVNVGFGDGYPSRLSNNSYFLVHGQRVPLVGRICMRAMMMDLSSLHQPKVGDEVVMIGEQKGERIRLEELAERAEALPSEFLLGLGKRVARVYERSSSGG